jgi:hypothetical protein
VAEKATYSEEYIMNSRLFVATILLAIGPGSHATFAQALYRVATPALTFSSSPRGNGMGGVEATLPSQDAGATIANPGQLGLFSLNDLVSAAIYAPKTDLFPNVKVPLTMTVSAINAGMNLQNLLSLPFSAGLGVGYSRTFVDFGEIFLTSSAGPQIIGSVKLNDTYENYSVGLGFEYIARLGIGMNFKKISSRMPAISTTGEVTDFVATPSATDFGILLVVPVPGIIGEISGTSLSIAKGIDPFLDLSGSYVKSNVGGEVKYVDGYQGDPLPRTALVGLGIEGGLTAHAGKSNWRMISLSIARQAEDILVIPHNDGTFDYKGGLGDLSIGENLLIGRTTAFVLIRKGWQVGAGEFIYIRGGSVKGDGYGYATSGYTLSLGGLVRLMEFAVPPIAENSWLSFIGEHIDLQYHSASYDSQESPWDGTTFKGVNVVFHGLPW